MGALQRPPGVGYPEGSHIFLRVRLPSCTLMDGEVLGFESIDPQLLELFLRYHENYVAEQELALSSQVYATPLQQPWNDDVEVQGSKDLAAGVVLD